MLDVDSRERLERESVLVRPERSRVSAFCTELTTLTQEQVNAGISFTEACALLRDRFSSQERVWASFGDYDRKQFAQQCRSWHVEYPFGEEHLNVKAQFGRVWKLSRAPGMSRAMQTLKMPLEGTHHRGGDDAWNIAAILAKMLERESLEELLTADRARRESMER